MPELVTFANGNVFVQVGLVAGAALGLFGMFLLTALMMDALDARFNVGGICGALAGVIALGGLGGYAGWSFYQQPGAYIGAVVTLAAGMAVIPPALRFLGEGKRDP